MSLFPVQLIKSGLNINFMYYRILAFSISIFLSVIFIIAMIIKGFNVGVDFAGGIIMECKVEKNYDSASIKDMLIQNGLKDVVIQDSTDNVFIIKATVEDNSVNINDKTQSIKNAILKNIEGIEFRKIDFVGPQVSKNLLYNGFLALGIAFFAIMVYVAFRFEWQYGVGLIIALLHDGLASLGFVAFAEIEFDISTIAAILTIIGYSVNDSVVIYDRVRENFLRYKNKSVSDILNISINETLPRTILTVTTTVIADICLLIFGGPVVYGFATTVLVGIIIGTYSSIYISAPILIDLGVQKYSRS